VNPLSRYSGVLWQIQSNRPETPSAKAGMGSQILKSILIPSKELKAKSGEI
jgi:hypothetical protein